MPPSTTLSPTPSFYSVSDFSSSFDRTSIRPGTTTDNNKDMNLPPSARECLVGLIQQVEHEQLRQMLKSELKRLLTDQERIVTMLQQRTQQVEKENEELKRASADHQHRYEKAVREMQFFKKKCDYITNQQQQQQPVLTNSTSTTPTSAHQRPRSRQRSHSSISETFSEIASSLPPPPPPTHSTPPPPPRQPSPLPPTPGSIASHPHTHTHKHPLPALPAPSPVMSSYPVTPTSPQLSSTSAEEAYDSLKPLPTSGTIRSRSSSTSTSNSLMQQPFWQAPTTLPSVSSVMTSFSATGSATLSLADNTNRQLPQHPVRHTGTASMYSVSSDMSFPNSISNASEMHRQQQQHYLKQQQIHQQGGPGSSLSYVSRPPSSSSASTLSSIGGAGHGHHQAHQVPASSGASVYSIPMTPVRSTISSATVAGASGYTGSSIIQQRRVDPLMFGGSDGLWETISKGQGSDVTVEKIVGNFLRRGGSPNTAKQSPSYQSVRYGYGMAHALVVTKAPGALDLLLQQGANPNAMTMSDAEEDKVTPCYLAAKTGWIAGLQKLVQAGGDLTGVRCEGSKKKTALHVAAENCHAAVVEFIVGFTQGALNMEMDSQGASALHYGCLSGHTDLVAFLIIQCHLPIDQQDHKGEQPIHWATRAGRLEVVTLLVERFNANFNAYLPKRVPTPLEIAKSNGHKRLVDYLKGVGALTSKKLDKTRKEEEKKSKSNRLESALHRNGLFQDDDDEPY